MATPDAATLEQLAKSGSDLSKLHHVEFLLRFPSRKAAEQVELHLIGLAFVITEPVKTGNEWVIRASKTMYPVESDLMGLRDKLNAVAAEGHGTYDGWQARAVE